MVSTWILRVREGIMAKHPSALNGEPRLGFQCFGFLSPYLVRDGLATNCINSLPNNEKASIDSKELQEANFKLTMLCELNPRALD